MKALRDPIVWGLAGAAALVAFSYGAAMWLAEAYRSSP